MDGMGRRRSLHSMISSWPVVARLRWIYVFSTQLAFGNCKKACTAQIDLYKRVLPDISDILRGGACPGSPGVTLKYRPNTPKARSGGLLRDSFRSHFVDGSPGAIPIRPRTGGPGRPVWAVFLMPGGTADPGGKRGNREREGHFGAFCSLVSYAEVAAFYAVLATKPRGTRGYFTQYWGKVPGPLGDFLLPGGLLGAFVPVSPGGFRKL